MLSDFGPRQLLAVKLCKWGQLGKQICVEVGKNDWGLATYD
jgi:hypothetical protein